MKTLAIIAIVCLPISVFGGDFENWYFEFVSERTEISGKTLSSDDKQTGTYTGTSTGSVSPNGTEFTETFEYIYMPGDHKTKYALVWTKGKDGVFRSLGEDPSGNKFSFELTIKADKQYNLKCIFADGTTIEAVARLNKDDIIHSVDTARTKMGDIACIYKYTRSKTKQKVR